MEVVPPWTLDLDCHQEVTLPSEVAGMDLCKLFAMSQIGILAQFLSRVKNDRVRSYFVLKLYVPTTFEVLKLRAYSLVCYFAELDLRKFVAKSEIGILALFFQ